MLVVKLLRLLEEDRGVEEPALVGPEDDGDKYTLLAAAGGILAKPRVDGGGRESRDVDLTAAAG